MAKNFSDTLAKIKADFKDAFVDVQLAGEIKGFPVESPSMNYIFGGKFATGRIYEIFGPESSGKTTICTYLAAQTQKYNKERDVVLYLDYERTLERDHAVDIGLDISEDKFILVQPLTGEDGFEICRRVLSEGIPVGLIVWDSIGATGSATQMTDAFKASFGGAAGVLASGLRMLNPYLVKYGCSLVFANQERAQIGGYSPVPNATTTSGGFARKFFASWRGRVTRIDTYKEKGTGAVTGIRMKIRNVKSKLGVPNREAEIDLDFKTGINSEKEYDKFIVDLLCEKKGSWYDNAEWGLHAHGAAGVSTFLHEHPEIYEKAKEDVLRLICKETTMDADNKKGTEEELEQMTPEERAFADYAAEDEENL